MPERVIAPARNLTGGLRPGGDKSISHRYAILAGLADGPTKLENFAPGADCRSTLGCLAQLGVAQHWDDGTLTVGGAGLHGLRGADSPLDAGNSGSTLRMLAGVLAAQSFPSELVGDASLSRRPLGRVVDPLRQMGARLEATEGHAPLRIAPAPGGLVAIEYAPPVASAQVKTAVLLAGLYARGATTLHEARPTRDHTEIALRHFSAPLRDGERHSLRLEGPAAELISPGTFRIPGDPSSAAFFLCAAAMFPDANLVVEEVSLNPSRAGLLDLLAGLGAQISVVTMGERGGELVGTLHAGGARPDAVGRPGWLRGGRVAGVQAVGLIDEIPVLAVLATATEDGIEFADVAELRVKESDRLAAIAANLRAMGAQCEETASGLRVPGRQQLHGARITTHGDHRIAMAFAIAALIAKGETQIDDAGCVGISFPDFFEVLDRLAER